MRKLLRLPRRINQTCEIALPELERSILRNPFHWIADRYLRIMKARLIRVCVVRMRKDPPHTALHSHRRSMLLAHRRRCFQAHLVEAIVLPLVFEGVVLGKQCRRIERKDRLHSNHVQQRVRRLFARSTSSLRLFHGSFPPRPNRFAWNVTPASPWSLIALFQ